MEKILWLFIIAAPVGLAITIVGSLFHWSNELTLGACMVAGMIIGFVAEVKSK